MSDDVVKLAEVVAGLVEQVNRLTVRMNVAFELLEEARLTGEPANTQIIAERLARAEQAVSSFADPDEPTRTGQPAAPVAGVVTTTQQTFTTVETQVYNDRPMTASEWGSERERKTQNALDTLEQLGKRK